MTTTQKKGTALIIGGLLALYIVPFLVHIIELPYVFAFYAPKIIAVICVVIGIKTIVKPAETDPSEQEPAHNNMPLDNSKPMDKNKLVNVTLTGGIIGFFMASPQYSLNNAIRRENANGWRVIQVIPAASGNIFLFLMRIVILILTFFLYTPVNGYYIILEKQN